jgi:hypothetical protein
MKVGTLNQAAGRISGDRERERGEQRAEEREEQRGSNMFMSTFWRRPCDVED